MHTVQQILAFCRLSGNMLVSGAGGLRLKLESVKLEAVLPGCSDVQMGPANSLHALAYYYIERMMKDLISDLTKKFSIAL